MRREPSPARRRGGQVGQQEQNMLEIQTLVLARSRARERQFWSRFIEEQNIIVEKVKETTELQLKLTEQQKKKMMEQEKKMMEQETKMMEQEEKMMEQETKMMEQETKMMEREKKINEHLAELLQLAEELKLRRNRAPE